MKIWRYILEDILTLITALVLAFLYGFGILWLCGL